MIDIEDIQPEQVYGALVWDGEPVAALLTVKELESGTRLLRFYWDAGPFQSCATLIDSGAPMDGEARLLAAYGTPPEEDADDYWEAIAAHLSAKTDHELINQ